MIRPEAFDHLVVRGRRLQTTPVYDAYWHFAAERQRVFYRHHRGDAILTSDPILSRHRFTNTYRASDRVSQFLISTVIGNADGSAKDTLFRTLLFKIFNRIETWMQLDASLGPIHLNTIDWTQLDATLTRAKEAGPIYSAAYIMPSPPFGAAAKHSNHLKLLRSLVESGLPMRWERTRSLRDLYKLLLAVPSFGPFLAFQFAIDLNYAPLKPHPETSYVVAGPGARNGIAKCFVGVPADDVEAVIMAVCESQESAFGERGITFPDLFGRRLQPIDCQNLFCEIDKYARVAYPEFPGRSGRTRIKQVYSRSRVAAPRLTFPNSWCLDLEHWPEVPPAEWF